MSILHSLLAVMLSTYQRVDFANTISLVRLCGPFSCTISNDSPFQIEHEHEEKNRLQLRSRTGCCVSHPITCVNVQVG